MKRLLILFSMLVPSLAYAQTAQVGGYVVTCVAGSGCTYNGPPAVAVAPVPVPYTPVPYTPYVAPAVDPYAAQATASWALQQQTLALQQQQMQQQQQRIWELEHQQQHPPLPGQPLH